MQRPVSSTRRFSLSPVLAAGTLLLFLSACHKKKPQSVSEELGEAVVLNEWVVAKPSQVVSTAANLDLEFKQALAPAHLSGQFLDRNPFTFDPELKGRTQWLSSTAIRFLPDEPLPAGKSIHGVFHGKWALGEHRKVDDYEFAFKVAEQEALDLEGDFVPDGTGGKVRYEGVISFAQPVEPSAVGGDLRVEGPGGRVQFTAEPADAKNRIRVRTEGLARVAAGRSYRLVLPERYGVGKAWSRDIFLPGKETFRLMAHEEASDPDAGEAAYLLRFSEELRTDLDLAGFVTVDPEAPLRLSVQGKSLKVKGPFEAGKKYALTLAAGMPSAYGSRLPGKMEITLDFKNHEPEVRWLSSGVFLPSENKNKLQFKSMNARRVHVEVKAILTGNLGFFLQRNALENRSGASDEGDEEGGYYGGSGLQEVERVGRVIFRKTFDLDAPRNKWLKSELDLAPIFKDQSGGAFVVSLSMGRDDLLGKCRNNRDELESGDMYYEGDGWYRNPCESGGYWYRHGQAEKLVIASDIALTIKDAEDGLRVYAVDVRSAKPVSGLKLELMSFHHEALAGRVTDGDGLAAFPGLESYASDETRGKDSGDAQRPYYVRGEKEGRPVMMKLDKSPWETSTFEVEGSEKGKGGLDAFFYADRGVHRPGDTVHFSAILRQGRDAVPAGQPVSLRLVNPMGQIALERKGNVGATGQAAFDLPTQSTDPTGDWTAELQMAGQTFRHGLKIETVKPNRLKVEIKVPERVTIDAKGKTAVSAGVVSKWLFGAPASGLGFKARITLEDASRSFEKWPGFVFRHPNRRFGTHEEEMEGQELDNQGRGTVRFELPSLASAPGPLEGKVRVAVEEKGGGYTARSARFPVEPFPAYAGLRNPFPYAYARRGEDMKLQVLALNPQGKPMPGRRLRVRVYLNRHYWWWDYDREDRKDFRKQPNTFLVEEIPAQSGDGPVTIPIKLDDEGEHLIEVRDEGGHESGFFLWASEWGSAPMADKKERDHVAIAFDRNVYHPGDEGKLTFKSPGEGRALVTVEQGKNLLWSKWVETKAGETFVRFPVDDRMMPNAYAAVSLIQPHAQAKNDLPMRLYGVKPFYVEDAGAHMPLSLDAPREIRPDADFKLTVKSDSKEDATFTVAVVDEGLLDLTDFATPEPSKHFLRKIRLGVRTLDDFDDFIGALLPDMDRFFRIGGDDMEMAARKRAGDDRGRRFRPVALFQGPITLKAGERRIVTLHMPHYVGSVRIMVVAAGKRGFASREAAVPVKTPLMVLSTLPRVASPGDRFDLPVSVFRMDEAVKKVRVTATAEPPLILEGAATQEASFGANQELVVRFAARALATLGVGKVTLKAEVLEGPAHLAHETVELPVRSPNPYTTVVTDLTLNAGAESVLTPKPLGVEGANAAALVFTRMPDLQADRRLRDLIRYPYGCLEQTTSSAFPQLYMAQVLDLKSDEKQQITDHINAAIRRMPDFVMTGGGFSLWPVARGYNAHEDEWVGLYAGHFLIEAKSLGYNVPGSLLDGWLRRESGRSKNVNDKDHRYQAYRLFLLALAERPDMGAMNLLRENHARELDPLPKKLLGAAYALAGKTQEGSALDSKVVTDLPLYREMDRTYGSDLRDQALMAYLDVKLGNVAGAGERLAKVIKRFQGSYWATTQEQAFALLALGAYAQKAPLDGGNIKFSVAVDGKEKTYTLDRGRMRLPITEALGKTVRLKVSQGGPLYASLQVEGIPLDNPVRDVAAGLALKRGFYTLGGQPIDLADLKQNGDYMAVYALRNTSAEHLSQVALSSVFPAGWEIENPRVGDADQPEWIQNLSPATGHFLDIRDDRMNWFFDIASGYALHFVAKVHLSFTGDWVLPPVTAEAMYKPEVRATIAGGRVTVK